MRRPKLINFTAVKTKTKFSIKASLNYIDNETHIPAAGEPKRLETPFDYLGLLGSNEFKIKLVGLNDNHQRVFRKIYESDSYGNFEFVISKNSQPNLFEIKKFQLYEVSSLDGIEYLLGTRIPVVINYPKKIVISDFDKTLVDTRYSTAIEVYESLRNPINHFPTIDESLKLLKSYIEEGFQPFILSASPHFYEKSIRDWLYQQEIYSADILLKDYRKIISVLDGLLTTKDLKSQGFYKLNQLVSIINMTGLPDELILMGDGFESDPLIYLLLDKILENKSEPWQIWNNVKKLKAFKLSKKQDSLFLNKVYQLQNEIQRKGSITKTKIHIRKPRHIEINKNHLNIFSERKHKIDFYLTN